MPVREMNTARVYDTDADLIQLRTMYGRLAMHQYLALACVAAADALLVGLYATGKGHDPGALMDAYKAARAELEAAATERDIG